VTLKLWHVGVLLGRYAVPAGDGSKYVAIATGTPWGTVYVKGKDEEVRAYREREEQSHAQSKIRAAIPAVEAYYADNNSYAGMTLEHLQKTYDSSIEEITIQAATATTYCVESTTGSETWSKAGPGADILAGSCG
jgi:hypothetical protein